MPGRGRTPPQMEAAMDFSLSPEQQRFRDDLRAWLQENLGDFAPSGRAHGAETAAPLETIGRRAQVEIERGRAWQRRLFEGGYAGISWPREYGGRGGSIIEEMIFNQELAEAKTPPLINGDAEFNEMFFTDLRVPAENILGSEGEGWRVAMTTLMHERASLGVGLQVRSRIALEELRTLARATMEDGRSRAADPLV